MLNSKIENRIELSSEELWFLMSLFGPHYLIGMENPHLGWLASEIEDADKETVRSLIERGFVKVGNNAGLEIIDPLQAMVRACVEPKHSLVVHSQQSIADEVNRFFHFTSDYLVEHNPISGQKHLLTVIPGKNLLGSYLSNELRQESPVSDLSKKFFLAEKTLGDIARLFAAGNPEEGSALIDSCLPDKTISAALAEAFAKPVANASFVVIVNQGNPDTQHVRGFAILEGEHAMWLMRPVERNGKAEVEFTPANAQLAKQRFEEILP